jgi:hypothetical protein
MEDSDRVIALPDGILNTASTTSVHITNMRNPQWMNIRHSKVPHSRGHTICFGLLGRRCKYFGKARFVFAGGATRIGRIRFRVERLSTSS